jgi:hypothetical protein
MEKILFITPHLSTGGAPQVLVKRIEILKNNYDIYVIEYANLSDQYVVQKNMLKTLIKENKFFTLDDNKELIFDIISNINPDIIHFEEIPEFFMDYKIADKIYNNNRKYKIFETTHSSDYFVENKIFLPDKFIFVSPYNAIKFLSLNIPFEIIEYPIDIETKLIDEKINSMIKFKMDPNYKHVLNVGLFTEGKNQGYALDIAKKLSNEKIIFHFVGNQAINFKNYWEPILNNKPDNCIIWGERSDIDDFYNACDLFLFTSIRELNPLVLKESLQKQLPIFLFPLDTYLGKYDNNDSCLYLTGNVDTDSDLIKKHLLQNKKQIKCIYDSNININILTESLTSLIDKFEYIENIDNKNILNYIDNYDYLIYLKKYTNYQIILDQIHKQIKNKSPYYNDHYMLIVNNDYNNYLNGVKRNMIINYNPDDNKFLFSLKNNNNNNIPLLFYYRNEKDILLYKTQITINKNYISWSKFNIKNSNIIFIDIFDINNNFIFSKKIIINNENIIKNEKIENKIENKIIEEKIIKIDTIINVDINDITLLDNIIIDVKNISDNIILVLPDDGLSKSIIVDIFNKYQNKKNIKIIKFDYFKDKMVDVYNISREIGKKYSINNWLLFLNSNESIIYTNIELILNDIISTNNDLFLLSDKDSPLLVKKEMDIKYTGSRLDISLNNMIDNKLIDIEDKFKIKLYKKIK